MTDESALPALVPGDSPPLKWSVFWLALLVSLIPVMVAYPIGWDTPLHVARASIFMRQGLPLFHDVYRFDMQPLPNLAVDILLPALGALLPFVGAVKAFVALTLVLQSTGAAALTVAVQKRLTSAALLIPLMGYSFIFAWGFLGYLFSIGIALWGVATYVLLRERPFGVRVLVLALFGIAAYFGHLSAFGLMAAAIAAYEVIAWFKERRAKPFLMGAAVVLLACLVPAYVHLRLSPVGQSVGFRPPSPGQWLGDLNSLLNAYRTPTLSILHVAFAVGVVALLLTRRLGADRRLMALAGMLFLVYLAMPLELYGSMFANTRVLPFVGFVFLAALRTRSPEGRSSAWVPAFAGALLLWQAASISMLWRLWSQDRSELLAGAAKAPPGTMFISIEDPRDHMTPPPSSLPAKILSRIVKSELLWQPPANHATDEVATVGEYFPVQLTLTPGKQPVNVGHQYTALSLLANTDFDAGKEPVTAAQLDAMSPAERPWIYRSQVFNPLPIDPDRRERIGQVLRQCDQMYRQIRRQSGVYPAAGTYVVHVHRLGPAANPYPGLLRSVADGRIYSVYELRL